MLSHASFLFAIIALYPSTVKGILLDFELFLTNMIDKNENQVYIIKLNNQPSHPITFGCFLQNSFSLIPVEHEMHLAVYALQQRRLLSDGSDKKLDL